MAFKTFNIGDVLTASDVNTYLMKQAAIVCTSGTRPASPVEGMLIYQTDLDTFAVYNGSAWVEITPEAATVATAQTRNNAAFGDLTTVGPAVTLATGTKALVVITSRIEPVGANAIGYVSVDVSGATTIAAADTAALCSANGSGVGWPWRLSAVSYLSALTAGNNTFTLKYRSSANTTFTDRTIAVLPIP